MVVERSTISLEGSAELRAELTARGVQMLPAPVSGNPKVIKAGRLSFLCSGPRAAFDAALPSLKMIARSASYVGEGEFSFATGDRLSRRDGRLRPELLPSPELTI